ncbi:hypothetical protein Mth01_32990 [Sphaerimonospora thailandensis]|uniref:Uncharacterized protein n=2 Tax=Sphaerimonospora thailandensis TaxID=795644 RepID=A0A8J3RB36_9ACTN|nr:hypothetical protein Mth01_32990 [Sphaerimonospora thailandensis]
MAERMTLAQGRGEPPDAQMEPLGPPARRSGESTRPADVARCVYHRLMANTMEERLTYLESRVAVLAAEAERTARLEEEVRTLRARQDAMAGVAISETYRIVQETHADVRDLQATQAQQSEILTKHTEVLGRILERLDAIDARLSHQ